MLTPKLLHSDPDLLWLCRATESIPAEYFELAVAGRDLPRARERVYAYELYHQLRKFAGDSGALRLMGEIDKRGNAIVSAALAPDLVWHIPGSMHANSLVIEIKAAVGRIDGFRKDLRTLTRFRSEFGYSRAVLLVYGTTARIPLIRARATSIRDNSRGLVDLSTIELWWHEVAGQAAHLVTWTPESAR